MTSEESQEARALSQAAPHLARSQCNLLTHIAESRLRGTSVGDDQTALSFGQARPPRSRVT